MKVSKRLVISLWGDHGRVTLPLSQLGNVFRRLVTNFMLATLRIVFDGYLHAIFCLPCSMNAHYRRSLLA